LLFCLFQLYSVQ